MRACRSSITARVCPPKRMGGCSTDFRRRRRAAMGIGLSLCKNIVTRHGGEIWAKSAPQGGLQCSFTLPIVAVPAR
uniref:ATP-binding protein n=1 Tax=Paraburkholderia sp. RL17-337-BIB-A TaxID=3031636 RepID=UPI0038BAD97E